MPKLNGSTVALVALATLLVACTDQATAPSSDARRADVTPSSDTATTPALVRKLAAGRGITTLPRRQYVRPALVRLGRALAFDKILSGNRDIACTTCHLPAFATGDDKSLSIGQGGSGLGPDRTHPQGVFIPRNAPAFFRSRAASRCARRVVMSWRPFPTPPSAPSGAPRCSASAPFANIV